MTSDTPMARDSRKTKERILAAGKTLFSQRGYPKVGIRDIADHAGVNNTLVARYFGSKAGLFKACLIDAINLRTFGSTETTNFVGMFMEGLLGPKDVAGGMVLLSAGDPDVRDIIIDVTNAHLIPELARSLGAPFAEERALQVLILASGFEFSTRLLPVGCGPSPTVQAWFRSALEEIVLSGLESSPLEDRDLETENAELRRLVVDLLIRQRRSE